MQQLIEIFKQKYPYIQDEDGEYPESDKMELDNLDRARLKYDESGEIVVENEHGTEFPLSDLSEEEVKCFIAALQNNWC